MTTSAANVCCQFSLPTSGTHSQLPHLKWVRVSMLQGRLGLLCCARGHRHFPSCRGVCVPRRCGGWHHWRALRRRGHSPRGPLSGLHCDAGGRGWARQPVVLQKKHQIANVLPTCLAAQGIEWRAVAIEWCKCAFDLKLYEMSTQKKATANPQV